MRNTSSFDTTSLLPAICLLNTAKEPTLLSEKLNNLSSSSTDNWQIEKEVTLEPYSFLLKKAENNLLVVTGTQINTAEGLEVLVIGDQGNVSNGMPIKQVLEQQRDGLLNIVPWAVGKWLSTRGQVLSQLLASRNQQPFVLGDNAGRPWLWKNIKQLNYAKAHNIPILAGSDPLPLKKHYLKSGSYGNLINTQLNSERPWHSIIQAIHNQTQRETFGQLSSNTGFIINQLKLRL